MHFTPLAFVAALVAAVAAQSKENPFKINSAIQITAGKPYTIQWNPTTQGPVSLSLRSGASSDLGKGTTIVDSTPNSGSYTFTLPASTTRNSDYTIQIQPVGKPDQANFTPQFVVESSNTVESQSNAASSAKTTEKSTSTKSSSSSSSTDSSASASASASSSASASGTASAAATTAASAPSGAAAVKNLNFQGGVAAVMIGAAALF